MVNVPDETCRDNHSRITQDLEHEELEVRELVLETHSLINFYFYLYFVVGVAYY